MTSTKEAKKEQFKISIGKLALQYFLSCHSGLDPESSPWIYGYLLSQG